MGLTLASGLFRMTEVALYDNANFLKLCFNVKIMQNKLHKILLTF